MFPYNQNHLFRLNTDLLFLLESRQFTNMETKPFIFKESDNLFPRIKTIQRNETICFDILLVPGNRTTSYHGKQSGIVAFPNSSICISERHRPLIRLERTERWDFIKENKKTRFRTRK